MAKGVIECGGVCAFVCGKMGVGAMINMEALGQTPVLDRGSMD